MRTECWLESLIEGKVLRSLAMKVTAFWVATPCGLVGRQQCFGGTQWLHPLPRGWRHLVTAYQINGVTFQMIVIL
jgi:hypothetical protein